MRFQIWIDPDKTREPVYSRALSTGEVRALKVLGYEMVHEFGAVSKETAEAYFVGWCDNMNEGQR